MDQTSYNSLNEESLPPEAHGARELISYLYQLRRREDDKAPDSDAAAAAAGAAVNGISRGILFSSSLSTDAGATIVINGRSKSNEDSGSDYILNVPMPRVGLAFPVATPIDKSTGQRFVYFWRQEKPVPILGEPRQRFLHIVFNSPGSPTHMDSVALECLSGCGTLLGYSDDNTELIWHERGELFASRVHISNIASVRCVHALRCLHCAHVVPSSEVMQHTETHLKGGGRKIGAFVNRETLELACGDTDLLRRLMYGEFIGSGAQGEILLCHTSDTQEEFALKRIHHETHEEALTDYHRAVRFMSIQHEHLLEYLAVRLLPDRTTTEIVMPLYNEGDLARAIRQFTGERFEENYICSLVLQIVTALLFLHERNPPIVHGDIKVENLLLFEKGARVVLSDFDTCKELTHRSGFTTIASGTPGWMAPESVNKNLLMPASDLWSVGLVMYVLAILPDYPVIHNPNTDQDDLLNASVWDDYEQTADEEDENTRVSSGDNEGAIVTTNAPSIVTDSKTSATSSSSQLSSCEEREHSKVCSDVTSHSTVSPVLAGEATPPTVVERPPSVRRRAMRLKECVEESIIKRGYSPAFAKLTASLLLPDPAQRPSARAAKEELIDIMEASLFF